MDKKLVGLVALFFISFAVFSTLMVTNRSLTSFTRANVQDTKADLNKSLIVVYPIVSQSGAQEAITATVFVRNSRNSPLENKQVTLTSTLGTVREGTVVTQDGKATFHITSTTPGQSVLTAEVMGEGPLTQNVTVTFSQ